MGDTMTRAPFPSPMKSLGVFGFAFLLGALAGTPAGLSRIDPSPAATTVTLAGGRYVFDGRTAAVLRGDHGRAELSVASGIVIDGTEMRILATLLPASDGPEPELWPSLVHARFVEADVSDGPGGLLTRRFREDGPFPGEVLHVTPDVASGFAARCRADAPDGTAACMTTIRRDGLDVVIRFPKPILADWPRIMGRIETVLADARRRAGPSA